MFPIFSARALGLELAAEGAIELAASAGFEGVDLPVRDLVLGGADLAGLRARMDALGLRGGTWPLPVDWRGDEASFERDLRRLDQIAAGAAALGLLGTGTWVLPETPRLPLSEDERGPLLASVAAWHVRRLGAIARVLHRSGIRLGLEVIGVRSARRGRGVPFVHRLADFDRWLGGIWDEAPGVGLIVDGFQLYAAGEDVEAGLERGVGRIVAVHVADLPAGAAPDRDAIRDDDRGLPGENGAIDSGRLLARLAEQRYEGPVTAEPFGKSRLLSGRPSEEVARIAATTLRAVWPATAPGLPRS